MSTASETWRQRSEIASPAPLAGYMQSPPPLHTLFTSWVSRHSSSGSYPYAMKLHVPLEPEYFFAKLHAIQGPSHGVLQHTPSTQLPLLHSFGSVHATPIAFCVTHVPPEQ